MRPKRTSPPPFLRTLLAQIVRAAVLFYCCCHRTCVAFPKIKLFEPKAKKVARLTAELAALEAERLSKLVVVFGYEFDKLGFYTSVSISTVLFVALIIQLGRSRRKWKRLALAGGAAGQTTAPASTVTPSYAIMLALGAAIFFYYVIFNLGKAFASKNNKWEQSSPGKGRPHGQMVIVFGKYELDKTTFLALVATIVVLLVALGFQIGTWCREWRDMRLEEEKDAPQRVTVLPKEDKIDVVIVGCAPRSVGWCHLMQFLDMPDVHVRAIVEPFYLNKSKCPYPPQSFVDLVIMLDEMGIRCLYHVGQLEPFQRQTFCIIAGGTSENPKLYRECIGLGASHIYLETPGAPTIHHLKDMQSLAATRGVEVYMGYQRLCSSFIEKTLSLSRSIPRSHVFFCHNEHYSSEDLPLVVSRFPEGLIHSMAVQELAILVTQFGVKAEDIRAFKVNTNRLFSEKQTFYKTNGKELIDLSRVAFKITTIKGRSVSVMADRCGGLVSFAVVKSHSGKELQRFQSHDEGEASIVQHELDEDKEILNQFIIERESYLELKTRMVKRILSGNTRKSPGILSIQDGIDVLALADYCTKEINAVLKVEA